MSVKFFVNGKPAEFDGPEDVPLLWVVREHLSLTGSKFGCGVGACGACTMHIEDAPARTCIMPIVMAQGKRITTIEGLFPNGDHPVQKAWIDLDVPQCGYCQSGMIMAAAHLLTEHPYPTDQDIDREMTNLCRCATYARIRAAIHLAAKLTVSNRPASCRHQGQAFWVLRNLDAAGRGRTAGASASKRSHPRLRVIMTTAIPSRHPASDPSGSDPAED